MLDPTGGGRPEADDDPWRRGRRPGPKSPDLGMLLPGQEKPTRLRSPDPEAINHEMTKLLAPALHFGDLQARSFVDKSISQ